ncbi:uncharacterized protein V1516DRAFT_674080 [Lipomyces oligophaga]|uniref:uncharacterized protein n=1 Tax=Lipomyces oligophaga TaxID=45792 RepID=UPI0034D012FA
MDIPYRISIHSSRGTVRYRGQLPIWPGVEVLGVEWDDPTRGKHSGSFEGTEYFQVRIPNSGSFIKSGRKFDSKNNFSDVLHEKYAPEKLDVDEETDIKFGNKIAERVGFDKFRRMQAQLDKLRIVALNDRCLAYSSDNLSEICPAIVDLDLSDNVFDSISEIAKIVVQLPNLRILRLNKNRLCSWELEVGLLSAFTSLHVVSLADTLVPVETLCRFPKLFPAVKELGLAGNRYEFSSLKFESAWDGLEVLDLSSNCFATIPKFRVKSDSSLQFTSLNLSSNHITEVLDDYTLSTPLESLDLRHNQIRTWKSLDRLAAIFPDVNNLKLQWNPVFSDMADSDIKISIIARWAKVQLVNNMKVSDQERTNAELYFMAKVVQGNVPDFNRSSLRWKQLCAIYGEPDFTPQRTKSTVLELTFVYRGQKRIRSLPRGLTVQRVCLLVSKWYKIPVTKVKLYVDDGSKVEMNDSLRDVEFYNVDSGSKILID